MNKDKIMIFGMPNIEYLAEQIAHKLGLKLTHITKTTYADGETMLVSDEAVRGKDVVIIASNSRPVNDNIMQLLLFIDSLKRASAMSITLVLTYYGYARQDRKASGRQPIGAKLVANLLEVAGVNKIIAVDLHNAAIQGFFNIPIDDLRGAYTLAKSLKIIKGQYTVVSPDHGGTIRARKLAELTSDDVKICIIDKRRTGVNKTEVMGLIGDINNQNAVIIDDIIDTGSTIIKAANTLAKNGAKKIIVAATHGIFSKGFDDFQNNPYISRVIVTDSIDNRELVKKYSKLEIVSLDNFLAQVLKCQFSHSSITKLYEKFAKEIKKNV